MEQTRRATVSLRSTYGAFTMSSIDVNIILMTTINRRVQLRSQAGTQALATSTGTYVSWRKVQIEVHGRSSSGQTVTDLHCHWKGMGTNCLMEDAFKNIVTSIVWLQV